MARMSSFRLVQPPEPTILRPASVTVAKSTMVAPPNTDLGIKPTKAASLGKESEGNQDPGHRKPHPSCRDSGQTDDAVVL